MADLTAKQEEAISDIYAMSLEYAEGKWTDEEYAEEIIVHARDLAAATAQEEESHDGK